MLAGTLDACTRCLGSVCRGTRFCKVYSALWQLIEFAQARKSHVVPPAAASARRLSAVSGLQLLTDEGSVAEVAMNPPGLRKARQLFSTRPVS